MKGVDVSSYQGEIDWDTLASQNISFAFIKATEGSSYVDKYFASNFENAKGSTQAENFIKTVQPSEGMLTPVIDLEFYGDKESNPTKREAVEYELKTNIDMNVFNGTEQEFSVFIKEDTY